VAGAMKPPRFPEKTAANDVRVLALITEAVEANKPCPSNPQLARAVGLRAASFGHRAIERLRQAGLITVEHGPCARVVTIVATGGRTAGEPGKQHWRGRASTGGFRRRAEPVGPPLSSLPPPVHRDPCPRCGVRRDVGCSHSRREFVFIANTRIRADALPSFPRAGAM
jgi:hypothetical protein